MADFVIVHLYQHNLYSSEYIYLAQLSMSTVIQKTVRLLVVKCSGLPSIHGIKTSSLSNKSTLLVSFGNSVPYLDKVTNA